MATGSIETIKNSAPNKPLTSGSRPEDAHGGHPHPLPSRGPTRDIGLDSWMGVAKFLAPKDFLSLAATSRTLSALHSYQMVTRQVVCNSELLPPANVDVGHYVHRMPSRVGAALKAEAQLISRLKRGPIVLDTYEEFIDFRLAPSRLHVSLYEREKSLSTVITLYGSDKSKLTFPAKQFGWCYFGAAAFDLIHQESSEGPLWLYNLSEAKRSKKCIAPRSSDGLLSSIEIPGRSAFWVSYIKSSELKLFEPDAFGTFHATRKIAFEDTVELLQSSLTGDRLIWTNGRENAVQLVQLGPNQQWHNLYDVSISGCGCEDISMSIDGRVALAQHCGDTELVTVDQKNPSCINSREVKRRSFWAAPDASIVILPSEGGFQIINLPDLSLKASVDESDLPPWMQAHLAWKRNCPQIEADLLYDPYVKRNVPVIVDAIQHGTISGGYKRFRFVAPISIRTLDVEEGDTAAIEDTHFDTTRQRVLYDLVFKNSQRVKGVAAGVLMAHAVSLHGSEDAA